MLNAEIFYQQHAELLELASSISRECGSAEQVVANAELVRQSLNRMMGKLGVHLAVEDNYLYPRLKRHPKSVVRDTAIRFETEMSGLKPAFLAFKHKWTEEAIRAEPQAFREELAQLFDALGHRVERENTLLYPYLGDL